MLNHNMKPTPGEYAKMTQKTSPGSPWLKNAAFSFVCGGLICTLGQFLGSLYQSAGMDLLTARATVSMSLIALVALFTAFQVYDNFARFAGAGSLVPITGFANAVVSPAIEFKPEGQVMGIGCNMFKIAGPVILYGTLASVVYGLIYWITTQF